MALIAPTLDQMKLALRLDVGNELDAELTDLAAAALERATRQAPNAPEATARRAMLAFIGYLHDMPSGDPHMGNLQSAWRLCGAQAMLGPWTVRRAGIIGGAT